MLTNKVVEILRCLCETKQNRNNVENLKILPHLALLIQYIINNNDTNNNNNNNVKLMFYGLNKT